MANNIITFIISMIDSNEGGKNSRRRSFCFSSTKREESTSVQEGSHDAKAQRMFMHHFIETINSFYGKITKACLPEIDDYYRFPLSKEEKIFLQENLHKIFERHIEKAKKQMIARNSQIQKKINSYSEGYRKFYGLPEPTSPTQDEKKAEQRKSEEDSLKKYCRYRPNSSSYSRPKSGLSQTSRSIKQEYKQTKKIYSRSVNINDELEKDKCQVLISIGENLKITSRKQTNTEQIFISTRTSRPSSHRPGNTISTTSKYQKHTYISKVNKSIDEIYKEKLQSRLVMLNNTLATSIIQSQGYKPKTKCWGSSTQNKKVFF